MSKTTEYKADLHQRYWKYKEIKFPHTQTIFDDRYDKPTSPPVFIRKEARNNIIINPSASEQEKKELFALVPEGEWHKWYGSMNSSQAVAQSVLGNLFIHKVMHYLYELQDDAGLPLFGKTQKAPDNFKMEHKTDCLGEPRPTSLDGFLPGDYQIAIECKFTETEVGTCSRPKLTPSDSNYESDHCSGVYSIQRERKKRCPLTESGILYWQYIPSLFKWKTDRDLNPCPLYKNYQLVRNILAAGVDSDGKVSVDNGHVVLLYDERNPSFQKQGDGLLAYNKTQAALRELTMIRKCSWQRIVQHLRSKRILHWLTDELALKYGF
jgi:hypothetical protein